MKPSVDSTTTGPAPRIADHPVIAAVIGAPVLADPRTVLAPYPHVAGCPLCRSYVEDWLDAYPVAQIVAATLAHHDSGHRHDPLTAASQYFAAPF